MEYSFIDVFKTVENIYADAIEGTNLYPNANDMLAKALNRFFTDFRCTEVIINKNFDKPMFGIFVRPCGASVSMNVRKMFADYYDASKYFEPYNYTSYALELDLRIFRDLKLDVVEATALILSYVNAMQSPDQTKKVRDIIDRYVAEHDTVICISKLDKCATIFDMILYITINNLISPFNSSRMLDDSSYSDLASFTDESAITEAGYDVPSFLVDYGQGLPEAYSNMLSKLTRSSSDLPIQYDSSLLLISWFFENYKDIWNSRWIESIFRDSINNEASILIRRLIMASLRDVASMTDEDNRYYHSVVNESSKKRGLIYKIKRDGIKSIEEDLFEYQMRLQNVETQDEAILLMRQLNSRMSILEDYLRDEDLDEADRQRWEKCYSGYVKVRDTLSKKTIYNKKMYGLFVDYNALQQMSQTGQLNTYY